MNAWRRVCARIADSFLNALQQKVLTALNAQEKEAAQAEQIEGVSMPTSRWRVPRSTTRTGAPSNSSSASSTVASDKHFFVWR
jgi:hypothetical protein